MPSFWGEPARLVKPPVAKIVRLVAEGDEELDTTKTAAGRDCFHQVAGCVVKAPTATVIIVLFEMVQKRIGLYRVNAAFYLLPPAGPPAAPFAGGHGIDHRLVAPSSR